ncbi:hypothetical protein F5878DRAFT_667580 [Lentinula raphanica]|uniref:Uncharacterized protein n=1 Tax=Lentinula raphanica TaxID=153919 RepID=A0AA38NVJ1_9AGAR|nr:hypothetical protein F5878DRAFT_667580 [Lentinula raphanica]
MASSSKVSSLKKKLEPPPPKIKKSYLFPADAIIPDSPTTVTTPLTLNFNKDVCPAGGSISTEGVLFLPATVSESNRLQKGWPRFPNSFSSAFELPRYASREKADLSSTLFQDTSKQIPTTFYPRLLTRFVDAFSTGPETRSEGFLLYQAITALQIAVSHIIHKHASRAKNHELLLELLELDCITACLDHYCLFWHRRQDCPLFAALFMALFCDYCENLLSPDEYQEYLYNKAECTGGGMSKRSRRHIKASLPDLLVTLTSLAIPLPLDPSTKEVIGIFCKSLAESAARISLLPDPSGFVRLRCRSLTSDGDSDSGRSAVPAQSPARKRHPSPAAYSDIELDNDDPATPDPPVVDDSDPGELVIPKIRESIARAAKAHGRGSGNLAPPLAKPLLPVTGPESGLTVSQVPEGPPTKKKKSLKALGKLRAASPSTSLILPTQPPDSQRLHIQKGPPDYFDDDDTRDPSLALMLPNPDFTITTGFASVLFQPSNAQHRARPPLL